MAKRAEVVKQTNSVRSDEKNRRAAGSQTQEIVRNLLWDITSINVHLDEIRRFWAKALGISGPQWTILKAIADLDQGQGVSVKDVTAMLHVDQPFITTQSKMLEKSGFLRRVNSSTDARVVLMSLSEKATKQIASLSSRQESLDKFIYADFSDRTLKEIADQISSLERRLEKAVLRLAAEF
jgi:MarR family transcriptional regulator, organic hydroperoxide resistance regulator